MFDKLKDQNGIYCQYIDGEFVKLGEDTIQLVSPLDEKEIGQVSAINQSGIDYAIETSHKAQKLWVDVPLNKRAEIMYKVADLLVEMKEALASIMMLEIAKDYKSSESEVERTADFIRFTADTAKNIGGENQLSGAFPGFNNDKLSLVVREPVGVVLAISPFNYPINLALSKVVPALMMGNSVVLKPATQGCLSALYLARIFEEAGLPKGLLNVVIGKGSEIGDYIVNHDGIDFINFTGSSAVGKHIASLVSMKPLIMELGGKDAAIVLNDANLDLAVKNIIAGAYSYSGQRCTAVKRILVQEEVADTLVEKLVEAMKGLKVGNPLDKEVSVVPLINKKAADFVESLINDATEKGAKLVVGGQREGTLIYPTLLDNVTRDMQVAWEEPFGPVLPVIRVKDEDEAIKLANESVYGLQSAVFTENINKAFHIAKKLEVGTVQINNKTERGPDHFPFLGVKSSGMGVQGIRYSMEAMSRPKAIVFNVKD